MRATLALQAAPHLAVPPRARHLRQLTSCTQPKKKLEFQKDNLQAKSFGFTIYVGLVSSSVKMIKVLINFFCHRKLWSYCTIIVIFIKFKIYNSSFIDWVVKYSKPLRLEYIQIIQTNQKQCLNNKLSIIKDKLPSDPNVQTIIINKWQFFRDCLFLVSYNYF